MVRATKKAEDIEVVDAEVIGETVATDSDKTLKDTHCVIITPLEDLLK